MTDTALTENKFFHITSLAFASVFLGLLGYFAYTVQDTKMVLNGMAHDVTSIKESMDKSFGWTAKRLDGHDGDIKILGERVQKLEDRRK